MNNIIVESNAPDLSSVTLSASRASKILAISLPVLSKGLKGGTISDLSMGTIANLAGRQILTKVEVEGASIPVLRPGLAQQNPGDGRLFSGWAIDQPVKETTEALDRWWTAPGRDQILAAGGYLVAVGSIVCAVIGDITAEGVVEEEGRINYQGRLAGILHSDGSTEFFGTGVWTDLARRVITCRVLGGGGGNFTRI
ncbi:hypothetical protein [Glutamicibacter protophormiae]